MSCGQVSSSTSVENDSGSLSGTGTGITSSFTSPSEMGVGDIMPIEFDSSDSQTVDFSDVESSSRFVLILGSSNTSGYGSSYQLSSASISKNTSISMAVSRSDDNDMPSADDIFQDTLRLAEYDLVDFADDIEVNDSSRSLLSASISKAVSLGDTETFRVMASLTSTSTYAEVDAEVSCIGDYVIFYVDTEVSESVLSSQDVNQLCQEFDDQAADEQDLFGSLSDVDNDGKIHVLMTKKVNELGALGGGIITGYFYAGDLYSRTSSNAVSNEREIIYSLVPDPDGSWGTAVSNSFAMSNLLPAVLPHELQHAISYNQHVFVNNGSSEENWLNEGLSHFVEDYYGYGIENPSRYSMFLSSPSTYGVVTSSSPNLMERGAAYLLVRYLYEQSSNPEAFLSALYDSGSIGTTNLMAAVEEYTDMSSFSEVLARWSVAMIMTSRNISQDSRYIYKSRTKHAQTDNWVGVCMDCSVDDNRGTVLTGMNMNAFYGTASPSVDSSALTYYDISTIPNSISISGSEGGGNFGILVRIE